MRNGSRSAVRGTRWFRAGMLAVSLAIGASSGVAQTGTKPPSRKPATSPPTADRKPQTAAPAAHPCGLTPDAGARTNDTLTASYVVAGVRVVHRCVLANDVVAANLYLLGGVRQISDTNAGVETLLLEVSERGTRRYPRDVIQRKMARLGTQIVVEPGVDWTVFGTRATVATFDSTWAIMADRLMVPTLDPADLALVRDQLMSALRQRHENPDALVTDMADSAVWQGHPYAREPIGTEASVSALTVADLRRYQREQMVTSRMLLVVVGHVDRARVERLVRRTIGTLPAGSYQWTLPQAPPPATTSLAVVRRSLPTNYIIGYFQGPPASSPDYQALRVATAALSGRLFSEIRSRRNLTYAVESPFIERAVAAGGLYVTTVRPDTVLAIMRQEIANIQSGLVPDRGLELLVQQFITEYFLDNETNAAQADFLARAQLFRGDWHAADRFVEELRDVTPEDVRRVAQRYIRNIRFAYVGDPSRITERMVRGF